MHTRQRALRDAVAVVIVIAPEVLGLLELLGRQHLAAVETARIVPGERAAEPLVHADVEVEQHEDRRLQPVGEVEGGGAELEALVRVLGEQQHVLGVAVRGVGGADDVALLRARRHAGRRPGPLHVEDHRRQLGEIGKADELLHQRDAGP
jgi:hypothetical protein